MPHLLKLQRADQHLQALAVETDGWVKANVHLLPAEDDPKTGEHLHRVRILADPPDRWGPMIGDVLFNLRSALDHLAFDLALAFAQGQPLTKSVVEGSEFPIFDRPLTPRERTHKIGGIHPQAQTIIDGLQPHVRRGHEDALWKIHVLNNIDKHRFNHLTIAAAQAMGFHHAAPVHRIDKTEHWGSLSDYAEVVRYRVFPPTLQMQVKFTANFYVSFSFGSGGLQDPVVELLKRLIEYVCREVVTPLTPFL